MRFSVKACLSFVLASLCCLPPFAFAFGGFDKANTLLQSVSSGLQGLSLITVTLAALWVGYKVLFGGNTIRECGPIIIGAIVIASASQIASILTA